MPEERFELVFVDEYDNTFSISDNDYIQENKHYHTLEEIIELLNQLNKDSKNLNELHEENQRLKSLFQSERRELVEQNNNYRQCLNKLEKENELLKEENEDLNEELMGNDSLVLLYKERIDKLKKGNNDLIHMLEKQSMVVRELMSRLMDYQLEEPIVLTKEDLEIMGKAISYYTHEGE